jgi:flagellar basal-body rod protein FlgG
VDINLPLLKQALTGQVDRNNVVANNLANVNTTGFKKDVIFFDTLNEKLNEGIRPSQTTDHSQAALIETQNPLNLALDGKGFFTVETEDGLRYTRQGTFKMDAEGVLRSTTGFPLMGQGGWITLTGKNENPGEISITGNGEVFVDGELVDKLQITDFETEDVLRKAGTNLYKATDDAVLLEAPQTKVHQGFLETSNVNPADEMVELIEVERHFESMQRIVRTLDEVFKAAATQVGQYR